MGHVGIENTKEVIDFGVEVAATVITELKRPGFQPKALVGIFERPEIVAKLRIAIDGIGEVPREWKDLDHGELIKLGRLAYDGAERIVQALRAA